MLDALRTIAWGLFLASSWTWCIGIYLPKILIERFGWPGFIAFVIPNVVGAALFGYVVRTRQRSRSLVESHGHAMVWFSIITLVYHVFFLIYFAQHFVFIGMERDETVFILPLGVLLASMVLSVLPRAWWPALGTVGWLLSMAMFAGVGVSAFEKIEWSGLMERSQVGWLAPILFFGFLLCPYFDLTFHRALRRAPSRHAFAVFGVAFTAMLLLSCAIWFDGFHVRPGAAIIHIAVQCTITMAAHFREIQFSDALPKTRLKTLAFALPLAGIPIAAAAGLAADSAAAGEQIYIRFLVFYGLVFPAYAIVFMQSAWPVQRSVRNLSIFWIAVALAAPLYELGFVRGETWLLAIPAGAVVAWLVLLMVRQKKSR